MKKRITSFLVILLTVSLCHTAFGQNSNAKDYDVNKANFWRQYLIYKSNLEHNITTLKPVDPSGLFMIDDKNNFVQKTETSNVSEQVSMDNAPWRIPQRDLAGGYVWSQASGTYTAISGGTVLGTVSNDDNTFAANPIGFTFVYDGVSYTTVDINANGYMKFGTISGSNYPNILSLQTLIVAALNSDLRANNTTSVLQYLTQGSAPNRTFTIQWSNYGFYNAGWDGSDVSFQIILTETTNTIKIVFGAFPTIVTVPYAPQVGINNATTDFNCRTTTTDWSATTAGGANTATLTLTGAIKPASGLTWTWGPPPSGVMGYLSSSTAQVQPGVPLNPNTINNQIIKVTIADTGITSPISITNFKFETTGSNNPVTDIANAKLYYTGSSSVFSTTTQYGSTVVSPNGVFYVSGSQALVANATNYFWLTYDLTAGAVTGDSVDAQCDSITGTNAMGTVAPSPVAPFGSNPIDIYCLGTQTNAGCPFGLYIANVNFAGINNASGCNSNLPYCYTNYTSTTPATVRQNNPYTMTITDQINPNPTAYGIYIDWNNNGSFADAGEYFSPPVIAPSSGTTTSTVITVPAGATLGNHRMRIRTSLSTGPGAAGYCSNLTYGEQEDYTVTVLADTAMTYSSSTTTQTNLSTVFTPQNNAQMIGMQVNVFGTLSPISATSFSLNTTGSTNPATDISKAKLWYTGTNPAFATNTQVGIQVSPNAPYVITTSQQLQAGTNYFWLTYDVPVTATANDTLDAGCSSITIGGVPRTPTVTDPAGNRVIGGSALCGTYTIPGSYATIAAAITDLNTKGVSCPVVFNVAAGYTETAANLTINTTGTSVNTITFRKNGAGANPLITAGVGTGIYDGVIKLNGVSYITFDGIDVQENVANVTTTTQMEWGYALLRADGTHGCQFNTIKNCNITLNKTNTATYGIYAAVLNVAGTAQVITNVSGGNSNNLFQSNNITNSYSGLYINGYADVSPYSFYDQNNTISGNNITNFGGSSVTVYGMYNYYQNNLVINGNTVNGGAGTTLTMYGIYVGLINNANLTISNNSVTLSSAYAAGALYGIYYGAGSAGTSNNINILNNTIQNCDYTAATSGTFYMMYCNAISNNLNISGNRLIGNNYGTTAVSTGTVYFIYNLSAAITSITISNNLDSGNTVNGSTAYGVYGIYNGVSTFNSRIVNNKVINNQFTGTTAAATSYGIYNSSGTISCVYDSNTVANNTFPTTGAHTFYNMYNTGPAPSMDYSYNTVSGNTSTGSGTFYSIYYSAAPGLGSTVNINNNTVTNQSKTTATGTGSIYGIYNGSSPAGTLNINNNTVTGFNSAAATLFAGVYQIGSPPNNVFINNNKVGNFTNAGISTIYGIYNNNTGTCVIQESQDSIFNITSAGSTIYGMYMASGNVWNLSRNRILGLSSNTSTTAIVYGMYSAVAVASTVNIYNNFISDLTTPASTSTPAIGGIYLASGAATTVYNIYDNTVYLAATSTSATSFGSTGIYALTTPTVELKNNAIVNNSTPGPTTGNTVAYQRSSITLTTYSNNSNNNCFYAGTPGARNLIYFDGTNSDQTLAAYKTRVTGRDGASVTENPPFVNVAAPPYDLRIQTAAPTQLESGGITVSTSSTPPSSVNITTDAFGTARYPNAGYPVGGFTPTAPDIGAHEFGGLNADLAGPFISYVALGIGSTTNRAFNNVTITDANGVNTTAGTRPRCYYKRSTDGNVINDNTSGTDGWKYVESNGTTSPFDFTIDYSKLNGGTGVAIGNVVNYFVIAQDLAGTPNVGWNAAAFTTAPTTVALVSGNAPISSTLSYTIGAGGTFSGTINVGTAQTYTNLTGAAGLFQAINSGIVTGNITIAITSDLVEDGLNALNATSESGPGGYYIRIVPATGTLKTISGTVANGMIRFNGARRIIIDGNNGFALDNNGRVSLNGDNVQTGPSKYLTFRNTNGANPTFTFINEAGRDSINNCTIESNNTGTASGTILFSTTTNTLGQGNDSIAIFQCDIRDRSDAAGNPSNAIYSSGSTTNLATYNNYNSVVGCNIYNNFTDLGVLTAGVYLSAGSSDWTISGNSFYQTVARAVVNGSTYIGVYSNSTLQNDIIVTNNYFGGSAPNCGSTALTFSGAGLYNYYAIDLIVGGLAASSVQGNTIQNINLTTSPASSLSTFFRGIFVQTGWINVGNLSGNTIGSGTGNNSITLTTNTTVSSYTIHMIHHTGFGSIMNNTIGSITFAGNSTGTAELYGGIFWINALAGQTLTISGNLVGSLTTANSIQCTNVLNAAAMRGMFIQNGAGTTTNVTNNVVANLTSFSTTSNALSSVYGIQQNNAVLANNNYTGNTVRNLTANTNYNLGASFTVLGISCPALGNNNISQNTIYSLYVNAVGAGTPLVGGILAGGASTSALGGTVTQNKMFDFRLSTTGALAPAPILLGINVQGNCPYTIANNMVSITNGDATDNMHNMYPPDNLRQVVVKDPPVNLNAIPKDLDAVKTIVVAGDMAPGLSSDKNFKPDNLISENKEKDPKKDNINSTNSTSIAGVYMTSSSTGACNYYYNTFYVGGTQPGGFNSWAFVRTGLAPVNLRNNLLLNVRTGGGTHYVIGNEGSTVFQGWPPTASNYNAFVGSNASTIGEWGTGNTQALNQWTISSGGDNQSWSTTSASLTVANLLTNVTTCDLTIRNTFAEAWLVSGKGIAIAGVNNDYQGDSRATTISGGCTDIGADEFTQTPPSNPAATQIGTIGPGTTTTYTLYGRTICSVDWGVGGTSYPTALTVNYQSGLNPPTGITTPSRNSNSYWTVVPTGTLQGTKYDMTVFFGDNETYNISSPSTNTLLARNNTFWQVYSPGTGNQQNDVNWGLISSAKVRGLIGFSTYALSDAAFPTPNLLTPVDGANNQLAALNLVWNKSAGATSYRVQLATDSLFNTLVLNDSTVTDSIRAVTGLLDNTNYWWRVNGKNGLGTGAYTQVFKFRTNFGPPPPAVVNLTVIPGGFYNAGSGTLNMRDTVRVYLVDSATCVKVDSSKNVLDSVTFSVSPNFSIANTGNYYILVTHRNHIVIASRLRQTVTRGSTVSYSFVADSSNTYGNNVIKVSTSPVRWGMIPADANQDQFVDGLDQTIWILQNGLDGYQSADFNGDGFVDGLDQTVWILFNGNSSFLPCAFPQYYSDPGSRKHVVIDNRITKQMFDNNNSHDVRKGK